RGAPAVPRPARIEAARMVPRRNPPPFDALAPRRLEQIVATDDVGLQNRVPRSFDRETAEMHDAVDAGDGGLDRRHAGEIGFDEGLVRRQIGGPLDVAQPEGGVDAFEQLAQSRAYAARRAGDQNRLHDVPIAIGEREFLASGYPGWRRAADSACGC